MLVRKGRSAATPGSRPWMAASWRWCRPSMLSNQADVIDGLYAALTSGGSFQPVPRNCRGLRRHWLVLLPSVRTRAPAADDADLERPVRAGQGDLGGLQRVAGRCQGEVDLV